MTILRRFLPTLIATSALWAQANPATPVDPPRFVTIQCYKLNPGAKVADYLKFHADFIVPLIRSAMEADPQFRRYLVQRNYLPFGTRATCDFQAVSAYYGPPSPPRRLTAEALQKADLKVTPLEYFDKRDAMIHQVGTQVFRALPGLGDAKVGDWLETQYIKVAPGQNFRWSSHEREFWMPIIKEYISQGKMAGWFLATDSFAGTDSPFNAITINVYNEWRQVRADLGFGAVVAKVHPGKDIGWLLETGRTQFPVVRQELDQVIELIDNKLPLPKLSSGN